MRRIWLLAGFVLVATAGIAILVGVSNAGELAPQGCSASNVDYYYHADTGEIDAEKMAELKWIPVWARDSDTIIGCVPQTLLDPTNDDNRALLEYGQGDNDIPLPIFDFQGELVGYSVVYEGSVPLDDAVASGDIPEHLVKNPPRVTDFDPDFVPAK